MSTTTPASLIARYGHLPLPRYTSYPTAPHFHRDVDAATYRQWLGELDAAKPLSLYVHVPFCHELCWYCGCATKASRREAPIRAYLGSVLQEISLVANALPGRHRIEHLHLGGGTPTTIGPDGLERLMAHLAAHFDLSGLHAFALELDPRRVDGAMVAAMARAGVNRVSLGVQTFQPEVQHAIGRVQSVDVTTAVVERLAQHGITALNVDLMYGLPLQTVEACKATVRDILAFRPARFSVFGYAHLPGLKRHQGLIQAQDLPGADARYAQFCAISEALEAAGYRAIGLDHFVRPDDDMAQAADAGCLRRNFQGYTTDQAEALIGVGASAIGKLPQGYIQNLHDVRGYRAAIDQSAFAVARGYALSAEDKLHGAVIERLMCDLEVDLAAMAERHGVSVDVFASAREALVTMAEDGIVTLDGWHVRVPDAMRSLLRLPASVFDSYLQQPATRRHAPAV
ncbi:MAG: oxygen-independent coproporphyrinogen III oxidase [Geminicoccaceae bacterium]